MPSPEAIVIGAGLGGLAAAVRLAARGHAVSVHEALPDAGGRARRFVREGIAFDAGPTVITAPFLIDELFALGGVRREERVTLLPVAPWYRYLLADGRRFDYGPDADAVLAEVQRVAPQDLAGYRRLREHCRKLYVEGYEKRGAMPFHRLREMLAALPALLSLRADRSVHAAVSHFVRDPALREVLSVHPLLVGGHPFRTSSIYMLIHHLEQAHGVWYVQGGTAVLVDALVELAKGMGVRFHFDSSLEEVRIRQRRVASLRFSDGEREVTGRVVSNLDPATLYQRCRFDGGRPRRWSANRLGRLRHSMGLYVLYFAIDGEASELPHHTIVLGEGYREQLDDIFDGTEPPQRFSAYLHRPKATDPGAGPPGIDPMYVLVPVPHLRPGMDWDQAEPAFRERVLDFLEARCIPGLRARLRFAFAKTPRYFADTLQSQHGSGFSIHPDLLQSAWFRFHNRSEEAENLYLVGAGTHPGAGVPGVLSSARVLDALIPEHR
ncbi:MAG: phytoene desaturase family protein [Silanimonas sp.]